MEFGKTGKINGKRYGLGSSRFRKTKTVRTGEI